jgi:hypothetical protein
LLSAPRRRDPAPDRGTPDRRAGRDLVGVLLAGLSAVSVLCTHIVAETKDRAMHA